MTELLIFQICVSILSLNSTNYRDESDAPCKLLLARGCLLINKSNDFVVKMRFYAQCLLILVNFNKMCFLSENSLTQIKKLGRVMSK